MRRLLPLAGSMVLLLPALSCSAVDYHPALGDVLAAADEARMRTDLVDFTDLGPRRAGDPAAQVATVALLEDKLRALGLEPVRESFPLTPGARMTILLDDGDEQQLEGTFFGANIGQSRVLQGYAASLGLGERVAGFRMDPAETREEVMQHNVFATVPGTRHPEMVLEISAHHDTVPGTVGADDNTSGMVVLLEVARLLQQDPPACSVRLCFFAAEEIGLVGSTEHVRRMQEEPTTGDFLAVVGGHGSASLAHLIEDAGEAYAPELPTYTLARLGGFLPDARRSDHAPYWDAGVPAVFLTDTAEFRSDHYHRPTDRLDNLDLASLRRVAILVAAAAWHAAEDSAQERP
jgi:aminopeptidase YwaD